MSDEREDQTEAKVFDWVFHANINYRRAELMPAICAAVVTRDGDKLFAQATGQ